MPDATDERNGADTLAVLRAAYDEAIAALAAYHERDGWRCSCLHPTKHDCPSCRARAILSSPAAVEAMGRLEKNKS